MKETPMVFPGTEATSAKENDSRRNATRACMALALVLISSHILNADIFPAIARDLPAAREVSTYGGAAFSAFLAFAAYRKPSLLNERFWSIACLTGTVIAAASLYEGLIEHSSFMLALGSPFGGIGGAWVSVLVGVSLAHCAPRKAAIVVPAAFIAQYVVNMGMEAVGTRCIEISIAAYATSLAAACFLIRSDANAIIQEVRDADAPEVLNVTSPASYFPFSHLVFVSILLFNIVCGYSLASIGTNSSVSTMTVSCMPIVIVLAATLLQKAPSPDVSYRAAVLCIIAGLLTAPFTVPAWHDAIGSKACSTLLSAGSDLFGMLAYCIVAAVGSRNKLGAVFAAATVLAAQWLGIGLGAPIAQSAASSNISTAPLWTCAAMAFVFIAFNYSVLRDFSFSQAIESVTPAYADRRRNEEEAPSLANEDAHECKRGSNDALKAKQTTDHQAFDPTDQASDAVASAYGLTSRETEIMRLLARGRTSPFIQEELVLSRNTVKTHVRHIYTKLGIHSHQELISKVEQRKTLIEDQANPQ